MRRLWTAVSRPAAHFEATREREPRLWGSLLEALVAAAVGLLVLALAVLRGTGSDAVLPLLLGAETIGLLLVAAAWFLGGLVLVRPAPLDVRAWEVAATAWLPAGVLGLSLLPVALLAPWPSLFVGLALLPAWHLAVVHGALRVHVPDRAGRLTALYALVVFGLPLLLGAGAAWGSWLGGAAAADAG